MKALKTITKGALAVACILILDACSKTKNSTPATTSGTTAVCTTGYYTATTGQQVPCQIGSTINTGYVNPTGWTGSTYPTGVASCYQYTAQWGVQYVPVNIQGTIQCVRYDVVSQYAQGTSYANYGYDYYYAYPIQASYGNSGYGDYNSGLNLSFNFGSLFGNNYNGYGY